MSQTPPDAELSDDQLEQAAGGCFHPDDLPTKPVKPGTPVFDEPIIITPTPPAVILDGRSLTS